MSVFNNEQVEAILRDAINWHCGDKWRNCTGDKKTAWDERELLLRAQLRKVVNSSK